jgi:hypothetical protein
MCPREPTHSIDTAVGRVDVTALEDLQENCDFRELLELVHELDECRGRIGDPEGLPAVLLRLHAMAHTPVNGVPVAVTAGDEPIWELVDALESEFLEMEEGAKRARKLMRALTWLAHEE